MRIDITTLSQGANRLELAGDAESLRLAKEEAALTGPVAVELVLNVLGEDIRIDGVVRAEIEEECSRCLTSFKRRIEAELHLYAVGNQPRRRRGRASGTEMEADGEGYLVHDGRELDLWEEIRSAILLSTPMQPLCSPDCRGLCPVCGGNLNSVQCSCGEHGPDPRWKGLGRLRGQ